MQKKRKTLALTKSDKMSDNLQDSKQFQQSEPLKNLSLTDSHAFYRVTQHAKRSIDDARSARSELLDVRAAFYPVTRAVLLVVVCGWPPHHGPRGGGGFNPRFTFPIGMTWWALKPRIHAHLTSAACDICMSHTVSRHFGPSTMSE